VKRVLKMGRRLICCVVVVMLLVAQTSALAAVSGSTTMAKYGQTYIVTASRLNFRSGPGTGYRAITALKKGTKVTYLDYDDGWWRVRTSDGRVGYVDRKYLTPSSAQKTGKYFVTASELRIRKEPNTSSTIAGSVRKGTMITISKLNGDWGYVSSGAKVRGWVALKYISTTSPTTTNASGRYQVTAGTLNVRPSASTSRGRIDTLAYGTIVQVTQTSGNWGKVSYTKGGVAKSGWVSFDYLIPR